jgi:adenylate cyclase
MARESQTPESRRLFRIGLSAILVGGVTLLILLAVGSVLWVTLTGATRNTFELLGERAGTTLDILESKVGGQLISVMAGAEEIARQFADGRLNISKKRKDVFHVFSGFLASHPQATALLFVDAEQDSIVVTRTEGYPIEVPSTPRAADRRTFAMQRARDMGRPGWADPIWVPDAGRTVLTYIVPVQRGTELRGVIIVPVVLTEVSKFLLDLETEGDLSAFILHDQQRVLAHPRLQESDFRQTRSVAESPLPLMENFPEPAFQLLMQGGEEAATLLEFAADITNARVSDDIIVITRDTDRYGPAMWTLGVVFERAIVGQEVDRLINMAIAGIAILILAMLLGFAFARHLNRQIGQLVTSAGALTKLDIASAPRGYASFPMLHAHSTA